MIPVTSSSFYMLIYFKRSFWSRSIKLKPCGLWVTQCSTN